MYDNTKCANQPINVYTDLLSCKSDSKWFPKHSDVMLCDNPFVTLKWMRLHHEVLNSYCVHSL